MPLARPALVVGLLSAVPLLACGGPPPRAPEGTPLAISPAQREATVPSAPPKQPEELVAWLHVEDPDAIVDLAGAKPLLALGAADEEIGRWLSVFDLGKPVDLVVTTAPPKKAKAAEGEPAEGPPKPGLEAAGRFRVKDVAKTLEVMKREFDVTVEGGRVRAVKKAKPEHRDDEESTAPAPPAEREELLCDFGGVTSGAEFAVCGSPHAMTHAGAWLRTGPRPSEAERTRSAAKATELARLSVYVRPLKPFLASTPKDPALSPPKSPTEEQTRRALDESLADLHVCTFELAREGDQVTFAMGSRYASQKSALTRGMFQPTSGVAPTDAFLRITEDASGSLFLPGGGPIAQLVTWVAREAADDLPSSVRPQLATMLPIVTRMVDRPIEAGYGIDAARVKKALAGVRAATKDASKATQALDEALGGYEVVRLPVELASAETLARAYVKSENEKEKEKQAAQAPAPKPTAKATPTTTAGVKRTAWSIRPAPARLGLPKGAFLMDAKKTDPGDKPPKTTTTSTESTLFVPAAGSGDRTATWVLTCTEDAACAERAKIALAEKPPTKTTRDVLFQRPGLLAAGHLSTLVGAFALHRVTLQMGSSFTAGAPGGVKPAVPASTLAEIEQHLSEPKLLLPFAIAAQPQGEGGLVSFEIRGERAAWKVLGEHASTAATGSFFMLAMLAVALATP